MNVKQYIKQQRLVQNNFLMTDPNEFINSKRISSSSQSETQSNESANEIFGDDELPIQIIKNERKQTKQNDKKSQTKVKIIYSSGQKDSDTMQNQSRQCSNKSSQFSSKTRPAIYEEVIPQIDQQYGQRQFASDYNNRNYQNGGIRRNQNYHQNYHPQERHQFNEYPINNNRNHPQRQTYNNRNNYNGQRRYNQHNSNLNYNPHNQNQYLQSNSFNYNNNSSNNFNNYSTNQQSSHIQRQSQSLKVQNHNQNHKNQENNGKIQQNYNQQNHQNYQKPTSSNFRNVRNTQNTSKTQNLQTRTQSNKQKQQKNIENKQKSKNNKLYNGQKQSKSRTHKIQNNISVQQSCNENTNSLNQGHQDISNSQQLSKKLNNKKMNNQSQSSAWDSNQDQKQQKQNQQKQKNPNNFSSVDSISLQEPVSNNIQFTNLNISNQESPSFLEDLQYINSEINGKRQTKILPQTIQINEEPNQKQIQQKQHQQNSFQLSTKRIFTQQDQKIILQIVKKYQFVQVSYVQMKIKTANIYSYKIKTVQSQIFQLSSRKPKNIKVSPLVQIQQYEKSVPRDPQPYNNSSSVKGSIDFRLTKIILAKIVNLVALSRKISKEEMSQQQSSILQKMRKNKSKLIDPSSLINIAEITLFCSNCRKKAKYLWKNQPIQLLCQNNCPNILRFEVQSIQLC